RSFVPNVLMLGRGSLRDQALLHLWPDRFAGHRLGEFELRSFGFHDGVDYRFAVDATLPAIVAEVSKQWRPDLVLLFSAEWLHLPRRVDQCPIPTALVVQDWDYWIDHTRFAVQACDLTITQGPGSEKAVAALGANRTAWTQFFGVLEPELDAVPPMKER